MRHKKTIISLFILLLLLLLGSAFYLYYSATHQPFLKNEEQLVVFVDRDDTADSLHIKLQPHAHPLQMHLWKTLADWYELKDAIKTGRYVIEPHLSALEVFRTFRGGLQKPIQLVIRPARSVEQMVSSLSRQIMIDSAEISKGINGLLTDSSARYTKETLPCFFLVNSYEVYWNISAKALIERLQKEHHKYWNQKRLTQAAKVGLSPAEVITLASIVADETAFSPEMPRIAGLYLNRLRKGMKLQADPTVKFALNQTSIRRILHKHLTIESPYNTYLHAGLPPGPISIPPRQAIEAVLNAEKHSYIYMCANADFSGTHAFASTYSEHLRNARKYTKALNQRGIK